MDCLHLPSPWPPSNAASHDVAPQGVAPVPNEPTQTRGAMASDLIDYFHDFLQTHGSELPDSQLWELWKTYGTLAGIAVRWA